MPLPNSFWKIEAVSSRLAAMNSHSVTKGKTMPGTILLGMAAVLIIATAATRAATPVLTRSYDNGRTGSNTSETTLTPAVVSQGLKKLFALRITDDPRIEAQPLYVPGLTMGDGQKHDVVYVFSMANTVWAFDANTG